MNPVRSLLRSRAMRAAAAGVIGVYLDLALRSCRLSVEADADAWDLIVGRTGKAVIVVLWHENLPLVPVLWWRARRDNPALQLHALISRHRDGRLIAGIMRRWGIGSIDGSAARPGRPGEKGGAAALRTMLRRLRDGGIVALTPDGPRGPRRAMQPGAAQLAAMSGVRVVPIAGRCLPALRAGSWDRMQLPLPFARLIVCCGAPVAIGRDESAAGSARLASALGALDGGEPS